MSVWMIVAAWVACGVAGSAIALEFGWRRRGLGVTVGDLIFHSILAVAGPFTLVVGIIIGIHGAITRRCGDFLEREVFSPKGGRNA